MVSSIAEMRITRQRSFPVILLMCAMVEQIFPRSARKAIMGVYVLNALMDSLKLGTVAANAGEYRSVTVYF